MNSTKWKMANRLLRILKHLYLFLIILVGLLGLICHGNELLLENIFYSSTTRAILVMFLNLAGCSGRLALVLFFVVKAVNGTLFQDIFCSMMNMDEAGPSSGACSNHGIPTVDQTTVNEVDQDELWKAVEAAEKKKEEDEWKKLQESCERHRLRLEGYKKALSQRAKEMAQEQGLNPGRCEAVEDAAMYFAEDAEDLPEKEQLPFLAKLMRELKNPKSDLWERIEKEVKRWRSWED
uniref:Uncharacterized protein n=1 Tax=Bougainvillea spectabilis TaxID=146096 RepID=A0A7T1WQG6_9CARY|nr:uncharacterized protein KQ602_mgp37 [Bougainvillea spectabilis]QPP04887.1 uncharacterized protein [Bougainvillea spectabilis]